MKEGNKKQRFSILFFSNLANNNVGRSVNQSIIKKVLISVDILNRTVNSSVDIPFDFQFFICATWSMHVVLTPNTSGRHYRPSYQKQTELAFF